jgi:protein TonB
MQHRLRACLIGGFWAFLLFGCAGAPVVDQATAPTHARTRDPHYAKYLEEWIAKVDRVQEANYPAEARGGVYGSVQLSVSIKADGSVESINVDRSSGHAALDRAAVRLVELASPFQPLPPEIRRDGETLVITRTMTFWPREYR